MFKSNETALNIRWTDSKAYLRFNFGGCSEKLTNILISSHTFPTLLKGMLVLPLRTFLQWPNSVATTSHVVHNSRQEQLKPESATSEYSPELTIAVS